MPRGLDKRLLAEIMERTLEEIRLCRQIRHLAALQMEALQGGRVEEVRAISEMRLHLFERLKEIETEVAPLRDDMRQVEEDAAIGPLWEEMQVLVGDILQFDEESSNLLRKRMLEVGEKAQALRWEENSLRAFLDGGRSGAGLSFLDSRR